MPRPRRLLFATSGPGSPAAAAATTRPSADDSDPDAAATDARPLLPPARTPPTPNATGSATTPLSASARLSSPLHSLLSRRASSSPSTAAVPAPAAVASLSVSVRVHSGSASSSSVDDALVDDDEEDDSAAVPAASASSTSPSHRARHSIATTSSARARRASVYADADAAAARWFAAAAYSSSSGAGGVATSPPYGSAPNLAALHGDSGSDAASGTAADVTPRLSLSIGSAQRRRQRRKQRRLGGRPQIGDDADAAARATARSSVAATVGASAVSSSSPSSLRSGGSDRAVASIDLIDFSSDDGHSGAAATTATATAPVADVGRRHRASLTGARMSAEPHAVAEDAVSEGLEEGSGSVTPSATGGGATRSDDGGGRRSRDSAGGRRSPPSPPSSLARAGRWGPAPPRDRPRGLDMGAIAEYLTEGDGSTLVQRPAEPDTDESTMEWAQRPPRPWRRRSPRQSLLFYSDATGALRGPSLSTGLPGLRDAAAAATPSSSGDSVEAVLRSGAFWLDVGGPASEAEMAAVARLFGVHPLTVEDVALADDATAAGSREKCEAFPDYYFVCYRGFAGGDGGAEDDDDLEDEEDVGGRGRFGGFGAVSAGAVAPAPFVRPVDVFVIVFRECVLSFHKEPVQFPANVLRRIDQLRTYGVSISPDWLSYAIIDDVTDAFVPKIQELEYEVDTIDELVLLLKESEQSDMLRRIGRARKNVMVLLRLLISKADVLKAVVKRSSQLRDASAAHYHHHHPRQSSSSSAGDSALYLGDIQDHVLTMLQSLQHFDGALGRAHSNYLAQISIEITQASNRTNDVVMRMTALASILVPLNIIT
ncbi:CorA metal ion transporter, partial [Cladochytrium tenue]